MNNSSMSLTERMQSKQVEAKASLDDDVREVIEKARDRVIYHIKTRKANNSFTGGGNKQMNKLAKILRMLDSAYTETLDLGW